jgi:hypothetical protein
MRQAGQYTRSRARALRNKYLLALGALVAVLGIAFALTSDTRVLLGVIGVVVTLVKAIERDGLRDVQRWARGADGEERVGGLLEQLGDGWHVIHGITFGHGDIDHVLIGPGGVFTIETKSHGGRIDVERLRPEWVKQAYAESKTLASVVGRPVAPLLVFSRAYLSRPVSHHGGVTVIPARMLAAHLRRKPRVLDRHQAAEIHARLAAALPEA